jgi:hypothetical protein
MNIITQYLPIFIRNMPLYGIQWKKYTGNNSDQTHENGYENTESPIVKIA